MVDRDLSRRRLLRTGAALGLAGFVPQAAGASTSSPDLEKFVQPMPVPEVREPDGRREGADYYDVAIEEFEQQVHPDLPPTTLWGFEGSVPGPVIRARRNERIKLRFDNSGLPADHLFEVDDRIKGTSPDDYDDHDGPVPDVRTVIHQHGLNVEPESDGQAEAWTSPDGVTGPRFVTDVHDLPNRQPRMTGTYHDHTLGISRLNNYAGLHGFYVIESEREDQLGLPSGEYDVPVMLEDRTFEPDGSLHYPDEFVANFAGDTAFVNGAVWPYFEVEPRRYRFRLVNQSNGRTFALSLSNDDGHDAPAMYQFAPDQGYLEDVVPIGHGGDLESLTLAPFERAEVVVDFSEYAGETFTVTNDAEFPFSGGHGDGHGGDGPELSELVQIRVTDPDGEVTDDSTPPSELSLPATSDYNEDAAEQTRHMTLDMAMRDDLPTHLLNGKTFHDGGDHAKPRRGATEIWEFENGTDHSHPIHMHLIDFRVIGRGEDGTAAPAPNERGPKDVVRVDPGETVRVVTEFGDFTGTYPWHCHVLEHEEQGMMRPFEVVAGDERGEGQGGSDGGNGNGNTGSGNSGR
ncbi:multicopper oxidase family protein [Halomicrobium urmianum]|uniref:multicopper oxidase family protein n=1 Tax=Halomicrobium urmianum TaxID=1586233 RepID=UPI001CD9D769|nr:multicopper oxidase domain-containing protein [Halomicrobium urmianum]